MNARPTRLRDPGEPKVSKPTAVTLAHARLREAILAGRFQPGELLRQEDLAAQVSVSRIPVREALLLLGEEGLVELTPHRGARVTLLSIEELEEIYGARMGLEGLLARYAAAAITPAVVEALRLLLPRLAALSAAGEMDAYLRADHDFMATCYAASGRLRLCRQVAVLRDRAERYLRLVFGAGDRVQWIDYSYRLFQACVAHDPDAAEAAVQGALRWTFSQATILFENEGAKHAGQ